MLIPAMRAIGGTRNYSWFNKVLSTLALLMARIGADHPHHALAPHDLALAADFFDRRHHLHKSLLLRSERNSTLGEVVRRHLYRHFVARQDANVVHAHLPRDESVNRMSVFQLYPECRVRQVFHHFPLHLDNVFLRHRQRTGRPPLKLALRSRLSYWWVMM